MKIVINTRHLIKNEMDGIGVFTNEVVKRLVVKYPDVFFVLVFDRKPNIELIKFSNVDYYVLPPRLKHVFMFKYWYQFAVKKVMKKVNPDLFIATDGMLPLKINTKTLAIIHDLNFEHHPEFLPRSISSYYRRWFPKFAKQADRVATVSQYSKRDITSTYNVSDTKIDVVYNGVNNSFVPIGEDEKDVVRKKFTNGFSYFVFVGTLHPRKNLVGLFKAFDEFKSKSSSKHKLLIVGKKMWWTNEMKKAYEQLNFKSDVIFTGRVNEGEMNKLVAAATALTYVPFFEGFGIPLVEAMSCGVPVITSNITSMPEVVDGAGILVDPNSIDEISNAMIEIVENDIYRQELIEKGLVHVKKFTWDKTASLLWDSVLKTIQN